MVADIDFTKYYNAITDHIASLLAEKKDTKYYFIIVPDYRPDIYVRPLNITYSEDTTKHLAIINLPEKYFYRPKEAIMLLAHEVGHYEGRRSRDIRAKKIFEMTGLLLLRSTPLFNCKHIVQLFAEEFGDFLYGQYQGQQRYVRSMGAQLDDVAHFLADIHYGVDYLGIVEQQHIIVKKWSDRLYENREKPKIHQECLNFLQKLDDACTFCLLREAKPYLNCFCCNVVLLISPLCFFLSAYLASKAVCRCRISFLSSGHPTIMVTKLS